MITRAAVIAGTIAALAAVAGAIDKPTPDFQNVMKSNAKIVDLAGGGFGRETNIEVADVTGEPSLRAHLREKDFDGIVKDAATLKANFEKVEAFWVARKADDAVMLSKIALEQVANIDKAARAQDASGVTKAQAALANTCRDCHLAHRVVMLTERTFSIK
jgi:hypothetical protein